MKGRIAATVIGAVVLALVLAGLGTLVLTRADAQRQAEDELLRRATGISEIVATLAEQPQNRPNQRRNQFPGAGGPDRPLRLTRNSLERIQRAFRVEDIGLSMIGEDVDARTQLPTSIDWTDDEIADLAVGGDVVGTTEDGQVFAAVGRSVAGATMVVTLIGQDAPFLGDAGGWFLLASALVIVLAALVSLRLGSRLARPILDATDVTSRIATGDLSARLPDPGPSAKDESAVLSRSINSMADTLERSRGLEQQFLLSVSHDLRTPLTSIKGYAEAITDGTADDPGAAAAVITTETRRMERLVQDLLDLARLDAHQFTLHPAPTDLARLVADASDSLRPEVERAGLTLDLVPGVAATVFVDRDRVVQVFGNLVGNAVRFARSRITIAVTSDGSSAIVSVTDDGPGIPAEDLAHVFERLYQSAQQPVRQESGTGLGLAIVRELVAAMGGDVGVASPATGGTVVWFRLPMSPT